MCIKWFKNIFEYEKIPAKKIPTKKTNDENHDKNEILNEQAIKFKKWYLCEFKEELQNNCFKSLNI